MNKILTQSKKKQTSSQRTSEVILFVGTKIGVFILYSDMNKRIWDISGPYLYGLKIINILYNKNQKILYIAYKDNKVVKVYKSNDFGKNWNDDKRSYDEIFKNKTLLNYYNSDTINMVLHPFKKNHIYSQTKQGIKYFDTIKNTNQFIVKYKNDQYGKTIVVDPNNHKRLWYFPISIENKKFIENPIGRPHVLCTENLGKKWYKQDIGFPIDNAWFSVNKRSFISDLDSCLYLGTKSGMIWFSDTLGNNWNPIISYLPPIIVMCADNA